MLHSVLRFFGRIIRNVLVMLLLVIGAVWAAHAFLGIGPGDRLAAAVEERIWALAERGSATLEDVAGAYWDEQTLLTWRTQRMIRGLEREIERLQWVEAESMTRSRSMDGQLDDLLASVEATREGMIELAALMQLSPGAIFVDGVRYAGPEIETYAARQMAEFTALQEQVELYRQAQNAHRRAALDARSLRQEAEQNIKLLEAHSAVLEATVALESAREPDGEASQNVHQLSSQLRSQLERNRRIVERRRLLEEGVGGGQESLLELDTLVLRGEDLAAALRQLATEGGTR